MGDRREGGVDGARQGRKERRGKGTATIAVMKKGGKEMNEREKREKKKRKRKRKKRGEERRKEK